MEAIVGYGLLRPKKLKHPLNRKPLRLHRLRNSEILLQNGNFVRSSQISQESTEKNKESKVMYQHRRSVYRIQMVKQCISSYKFL